MNFGRLRLFIHDSLRKLANSSILDNEEIPHSKAEFLSLCDMLEAKASEMKEDVSMPERPTYVGPPNPGSFAPSDELDALYGKERRASRRVEEAADGGSKVYFDYVKNELEQIEKEISPIEESEKKDHESQLNAFRKAHEPYKRRLQLWRDEVEKVNKRRENEAERDKMVQRARQKVDSHFSPRRASGSQPTGHLQWDPLPRGEATPGRIRQHYETLQREGKIRGFDQERLDKATALPYVQWFLPKSGLDHYSIFTFAYTQKVLMECPVYGNAIYVVNYSEERWLTMSKQELIESGEAKRIVHQGRNWYEEVKKELEIHYG